MFGLFTKSSAPGVKVIDKIWISKSAKWNACVEMLSANQQCVFIAWFEETASELKQILGSQAPVYLADQALQQTLQQKMVIFVEHYPLPKTEELLFEKLNLKEVPVLSALDEQLFLIFGGERTVEILKRMGVDENEILGHSMISKSIRNAQQKLEKKVKMERKATSQQEWFALNLSP